MGPMTDTITFTATIEVPEGITANPAFTAGYLEALLQRALRAEGSRCTISIHTPEEV